MLGLPDPTGRYPVGTRYVDFTDSSRPEIFTEDADDYREITVRVWYPAEGGESELPAPYFYNAEKVIPRFDYPPSFYEIKTNSKLDLPVSSAEELFPVLIFNHGWGEFFSQNTVLMEELASHGYIIFSIAHHYEAKFSFHPDGRIVTIDDSSPRFLTLMKEQSSPEATKLFRRLFEAKGPQEQEAVLRQTTELMPTCPKEGPRIWAGDIRFVIDQLEKPNHSDDFEGKMQLEQLAVFGMSMGGIASGQACIEDGRIKAGINMDGGLYGDVLDATISQPFMFMSSERYRGYDLVFSTRVENVAYTITVQGADHYDFHDFTILNPSFSLVGEIDGHRMLKILNEYTRAFFDRHLKGVDSGLLKGPSPDFPEVEINLRD